MKYESTVFVQHLRSLEIDEDGTTTNIVVTDLVGREVTLAFPIEAVCGLMVSLPKMLESALNAEDTNLRIGYRPDHKP
jgi:hypothetical protein